MNNQNNTAAFQSAFTLQNLEQKIRSYKSDAKEYGTTVSEQSEQYPLTVTVHELPAGTFDNYAMGHTLGYTQKLVVLAGNREDVEQDVCEEIRRWFGLDEDFSIEVEFEKKESDSDDTF